MGLFAGFFIAIFPSQAKVVEVPFKLVLWSVCERLMNFTA